MKVFKKVLKYTAIVLAFVAVYFYLGMVVTPKDRTDIGGEKYYSCLSIGEEKKNTLDMLFMGNSDLYAGVSPMEIYEQTGARSFCCAYPKQSTNAVKRQLKKVLKKQSPKVLFLETDCLYYPNTFFTGSNVYDYVSVGALIAYHARWKEIEWKDFFTIPKAKADPYKGYVYSDIVSNYHLKESFMKDVDSKAKPMAKSVIKDVKEIKKMCDKRGIKLVFCCMPTATTWSWAKARGVQKLADELGVENLDFNTNYEELGIDFSAHFRDNGNHLNYFGAKIITNKLSEYIDSKFAEFGLDDYRGVDTNWDNWLLQYKEKVV